MEKLFKDLLQKIDEGQWFSEEKIRQIQSKELRSIYNHHRNIVKL